MDLIYLLSCLMENLCSQAYSLKVEVENWCKYVRIETLGCDAILDIDEIERLLNER